MKFTIVISVMFILAISSFGCCQESPLGAVAGLSTSIPCDDISKRQTEAPFWFINGTVYELFSIPRHFPFIPVVNSYSHLTIPYVYLELDSTMFQCARFSENYDLINGTLIQLSVFPNNDEQGKDCFGDQVKELVINYQELFILENMITMSWFLNDTCSESVVAQGYTLNTGQPVLAPTHIFQAVGKLTSFVTINHTNSSISYKLEAQNETGSVCPSTRNIYYRFDASILENICDPDLNSSLCFPIPQTDVCSSGLNFVWASREAGRSCVCPAHNSSAGCWVFESCVEGCRDAVLTPVLTEEGSICISNLTSSLNGSLFHFVCSTEPCGGTNACFLQTVIASYIIIIAGNTVCNYEAVINSTSSTSSTIDYTEVVTTMSFAPPSLLIIISAGMIALFLLLLLILVFTIICLCCLRRNHGFLTFHSSRMQRHGEATISNNYDAITISNFSPRSPQADGNEQNAANAVIASTEHVPPTPVAISQNGTIQNEGFYEVIMDLHDTDQPSGNNNNVPATINTLNGTAQNEGFYENLLNTDQHNASSNHDDLPATVNVLNDTPQNEELNENSLIDQHDASSNHNDVPTTVNAKPTLQMYDTVTLNDSNVVASSSNEGTYSGLNYNLSSQYNRVKYNAPTPSPNDATNDDKNGGHLAAPEETYSTLDCSPAVEPSQPSLPPLYSTVDLTKKRKKKLEDTS